MPTKRSRPAKSAKSAQSADPLAAFLRAHAVELTVEEVFHVGLLPEDADGVRQHNHVTVRAGGGAITLCATALNWDEVSVEPPLVLHALATEAAVFENAEGNLLRWAVSLDWDPDSRAVERRFHQTAQLVRALHELLGERGYDALLKLADDMAERLIRDT